MDMMGGGDGGGQGGFPLENWFWEVSLCGRNSALSGFCTRDLQI
jgi:hypothetical protein